MSSEPSDTLQRIYELEIRQAHQDNTIADLNDVISAQWRKIEALEFQLRRMGEDLQSLEGQNAPANQKPPHY